MGLELKGVNEVVKSFENIQKMVERNITKSYKKSGEELLKKSNELAPKGTGNMVKNSDVKIVDKKEVEVRYNEDYALYVHEDLETKHPNGQAKFLQTATNDNGKRIIQKLNEDLLR